MTRLVQPSAYTIIEVLLGIFVLSIIIGVVMTMVQSSSKQVLKLHYETIAINLAREGVEAVFQRRDTNRLRNPAEKDAKWLCLDDQCRGYFNATKNYTMTRQDSNISFTEVAKTDLKDQEFKLTQDHIQDSIESKFIKEGITFFRAISVISIAPPEFTNLDAKAMKFCSTVHYEGANVSPGKVELCSSITNYKE